MCVAAPAWELCRSAGTDHRVDQLELTRNDRIKPWGIAARMPIMPCTPRYHLINRLNACAWRSMGAERPRYAKREPAAQPRPNGGCGRRPSGLTNGGHYTLRLIMQEFRVKTEKKYDDAFKNSVSFYRKSLLKEKYQFYLSMKPNFSNRIC